MSGALCVCVVVWTGILITTLRRIFRAEPAPTGPPPRPHASQPRTAPTAPPPALSTPPTSQARRILSRRAHTTHSSPLTHAPERPTHTSVHAPSCKTLFTPKML